VRKCFLAGNEGHLAGLNLRGATAYLDKLRLGDVWRNVVSEALHNSVGEFGPLPRGKLLRRFEDLGNRWSHGIRTQSKSNSGKGRACQRLRWESRKETVWRIFSSLRMRSWTRRWACRTVP